MSAGWPYRCTGTMAFTGLPSFRFDQLAGLAVHEAFALQVLRQLARVHVVRALVDIDEIGARAGLGDGLRRGDEGVRDGHHHVAGADARRHQREAQRVRAAAHAHALLRFAEGGEVALEALHHGAADEARRIQGGVEDRAQLLAQLRVRGDQVEEGNGIVRLHNRSSRNILRLF